jgi:hypothetical protein
MRDIAAGLSALTVFVVAVLLLMLFEEPLLELVGWQAAERIDMTWWRTGAGFVASSSMYWLVVRWHDNALAKRRKSLAARARA